jgi:hypothetical protein
MELYLHCLHAFVGCIETAVLYWYWYICQLQLGWHPVAVHIYTQTICRTSQLTTKQHNTNNKFGRALAVLSLCELYPGICLTTEGKARENLSQGSRRDSKYTHIIKTPTQYKTHPYTHTLQNSLKPPQYKLKQTVQDIPEWNNVPPSLCSFAS